VVPGQRTYVLLLPVDRAVSRVAIDWMADRLAHARILLGPLAAATPKLPARLGHPPFETAPDDAAAVAARITALPAAAGDPPAGVIEAVTLGLLAGATVIATDRDLFRHLIPLSSWSMNVPAPPTEGMLLRHMGIGARLAEGGRAAAPPALDALLRGDAGGITRLARERRLAARADGPARLRRIARRSSGLRPLAVYLDLLPFLARAGRPAAELLRDLARPEAEALLSTTTALFV